MTTRPSIFVGLPLDRFHPNDYAALPDLVRRLDESGVIDGVTLSDHVVMAPIPEGAMPRPIALDTPYPESVAMFSAFAAVSTRLEFLNASFVVPARHPVLLAKQLATLDQLSRGRAILGASASWQEAEMRALGVDFDRRYEILEDTIAACRALWSASPASFESGTVSFEDLYVEPQPFTPGGPRVWFASHASPELVSRVARLGDGWMPWMASPDVVADTVGSIKKEMDSLGRDPEALGVFGFLMPVAADGTLLMAFGPPQADAPKPDLRRSLEAASASVAAGATVLGTSLQFLCPDLDDLDGALDTLGNVLADLA